jgi:hypothetical protein
MLKMNIFAVSVSESMIDRCATIKIKNNIRQTNIPRKNMMSLLLNIISQKEDFWLKPI